MKIINWNVARPTKNKAQSIIEKLIELDADILVLTETDLLLNQLPNYHVVSTDYIHQDFNGDSCITYKEGENRVSILSKYPIVTTYKTYDKNTSSCVDIQTPLGLLTVYATIVGVFGGTNSRFTEDLQNQMVDFEKLFSNKNVCIIGDYNIIFNGRAYPSHLARDTMNAVFQKYSLTNLTANIENAVDHVAISNSYLMNKNIGIQTWNEDKKLSDHIGFLIEIK